MARLVIEHLDKIFLGPKRERIQALRDVNLTVEDKELMALVGPSGCGKSTLLRAIAGLEEPSRGAVSMDGVAMNSVPAKDRDVAMVFQNYALYPHMTVFENIAFGLKLRKYPKAEIESRVGEAAELLGLKPFLDRLPNALSGGERQRVALGRAIVRQPKVFLLDEPLSNLDAVMRAQMRVELAKLHARLGATLIYVTHDQMEAMTLGHRIAVLNRGVIQQVAEPMALYHQPANRFVAGFIGSPPMSFFRGGLRCVGGELRFTEKASQPAANPNSFESRLLVSSKLKKHAAAESPLSLTLSPPAATPRERGGSDGERAGRGENARLVLTSLIERSAGREIVLGVRPEDILLKQFSGDVASDGPETRFMAKATVEAIEPLGAETYLHLATGQHAFIARVPPDFQVHVQETIFFRFNADGLRFFDPDTGVVLC